jgi:F-type H+-transporting ATPase subunit epsilon
MDSKHFRFELITQEKKLINKDVNFAVVPSGMGPIGILPGHAPLIGTLTVGIVRVRDEAGNEMSAFVDTGFFIILTGKVTVIAKSGLLKDQIDVDRANAAMERAKNIIGSKDRSIDMDSARDALLRAKMRIKAAGRLNQ